MQTSCCLIKARVSSLVAAGSTGALPSHAQPRTELTLFLSLSLCILENETKVGGHKGAQNGAVKRTLFDASDERGWLPGHSSTN